MTRLNTVKGRTVGVAALAAAASLALAACSSSVAAPAGRGSADPTATGSDICSGAADLHVAGSTAQQNAMALATTGFQELCGQQVSYNGTGSGAGVTSFLNSQVDFAGSDSALNTDNGEPAQAAQACGSPAWNIPMITGPIAVAYNLPGVDDLVLDAQTTAKIFSGTITKWDDPEIAELNKGTDLPSEPINVFFRSDSSGTTDNFTNYLHRAAPDAWSAEPSKEWSGQAGQGKAKTAGVSGAVKATEGGIGYVEWSYAIQNQLSMAKIDTGSGPVALTAESAGKAVAAAEPVKASGNDLALSIDYATDAPGAYPIVLVTYEIVCSQYSDPVQGAAVRSFLGYMASDEYQQQLTTIGSAPLPAPVLDRVRTAVRAIS